MPDLLFFFLKNHEQILKSLNMYFSKETFVTQISVSGRPWKDFSLDGGGQIHVILGVLDMETTDLEEGFRGQNRGQNIHKKKKKRF